MASFVLILLCLGLGILFRQKKILPDGAALVLNRFIIYVSLPALTLTALHKIPLGLSSLPAIGMSWILFILGFAFFFGLRHVHKAPRKSLGTLILTGSLGNTSFVGFPLLEAFFGASALSVGVLVDQPGTFLVTGTLGVFVACVYSSQKPSFGVIVKKIFLFPPFIAVIVALALRPFAFPEIVETILDRLAITLIPIALIAVGLQLKLDPKHLKREFKPLMWGLGFKLFLGPALMLLLYVGVFQLRGTETHIILVESAMAPMITAGILATEYGLDSDLSSLMIGVGIPVSLITIPAWNYIFAFFV